MLAGIAEGREFCDKLFKIEKDLSSLFKANVKMRVFEGEQIIVSLLHGIEIEVVIE